MLAVVAACIRGNDRLKICVHNRKLWAQILCQNSIMDDADQAVQTALGRRLREPTVPPELKMETFMLEISAETREYLTELRSLGTDAQGREVLVGLTFEESKAYIEHGNAQVFGKHVSR